MRILSVTAGAASMYCGSCLRDNALAAQLIARGHDVTLIPLYTPLRTDEANVTRPDVLFGGISIYLQHQSALFRRLPRFVDRLLDSPWLIRTFADRSMSVDPKFLGGLTLSMLDGPAGVLRKEFDKLVAWVREEPRPDIVTITNSMLIGLARPLADALKAPVCCTLQGEALFLEGLVEPYRSRALERIRTQVADVDRFVAISDFEAAYMREYLRIPDERMAVVPLGIRTRDFEDADAGAERRREAQRRRAQRCSRLAFLGESHPRKACTCWPTRSSGYGGKRGRQECASRRPDTWPRRTSRISPACSERSSKRDCWATSRITARSTGAGRSGSCAASTSCRCRPPTTNPRGLRCSKPWPAAYPSSNRGAARFRRLWSGPGEDCWSLRTTRMRSRMGCAASGTTDRCATSSGAADARASGGTTLSKAPLTL